MPSEFDIIRAFFIPPTPLPPHVFLGIGDDCALINPTPNKHIAISSDMLIEGRHFFPDVDPFQLGHKALAVNLSDLAAMGARPLGFTLSLALPHSNETWLQNFSAGLFSLAQLHNCPLIGGDTNKGDTLIISITIFGEVPPATLLQRRHAKAEDDIWVSGQLGLARLGLAHLRKELTLSTEDAITATFALHQPTPRIELGCLLRPIAHAAIDLSDGLIGDLTHVLQQSHCDATINIQSLPLPPALKKQSTTIQHQFALAGGDDYELCFTAPKQQRETILNISQQLQTPLYRIGYLKSGLGNCKIIDQNGDPVQLSLTGFDHFAS